MNIKSFVKDCADRERKNHYIINILAISVLLLVIIFTLCFGIKVNVGSAVAGDGKDAYVKQNFFQIADLVFSSNMSPEEAKNYVDSVNETLKNDYGVYGFDTEIVFNPGDTGAIPRPFHHLDEFDKLVNDLGPNASKVNLLKYKLAYSIAIRDFDNSETNKSFSGSRIFSITGQLLLIFLIQVALLVVALVLLALAVKSLIKRTNFSKAKATFMLLLIFSFANMLLFTNSSFFSINWAGGLVVLLSVLASVFYCFMQYLLMDKRDFSLSMFIHNIVLLFGVLLALVLFLSPVFKLSGDGSAVATMGWSYLFDYPLTETMYLFTVMAFTLSEVLMIGSIMLPAILFIILILKQASRFMSQDYQINEKRISLIIAFVFNAIIWLIFIGLSSSSNLAITSQDIAVKLNVGLVLVQILSMASLIIFEIFYKAKPIKKELVLR